ncbi:MAG TPA: formylglycine-generating enzyme family protein [Planctomycetota bacterium]|jgi:formylglycine-generating enzyme required for sulfatase activity
MPRLTIVSLLLAVVACGAAEPYPLWDGKETVEHYARRVNLPATKTLDLGGGVKLDLVLIPAGKFMMGSPEREKPIIGQTMVGLSGAVLLVLSMVVLIRARKKRTRPQFSLAFLLTLTLVASLGVWGGVRWYEALKGGDEFDNERPSHEVTLTQPFYMGKYPVTQEQYQQVIGTNPSSFKGKDNPVEQVSWDDSVEFCKRASEKTGQAVRLPTEAEREYACRAGTRTKYYSGDTEEDLKRVGWYAGNSGGTTHPVGQKEPNAVGLYDMHGNVWEWCSDWYEPYKPEPTVDPQGPSEGQRRVVRGGSWRLNLRYCRSAYRFRFNPDDPFFLIGFRVVVGISQQ